ncbi:hypothetical protein EBO34_14370 [Alteribacter keqinensis]|uniref:Uncharacterized protein n=1 Tax=Alteribacter keqinensis TaxID=2483800 RepID=A0A3M7TQN5_9BACI|nr:hypothetical protein EBO34_14370 [Alteribacter keqinensis]
MSNLLLFLWRNDHENGKTTVTTLQKYVHLRKESEKNVVLSPHKICRYTIMRLTKNVAREKIKCFKR